MHKLLERQLRRHYGSLEAVPAALANLVAAIDDSYTQADRDRHLIERSLELASQELLQRHAELRARNHEQQVIFDSVPAMIIYKDTANRILRLNETAAAALGGTSASLEGKRTEEVVPADVAAQLYEDDKAILATGQARLGIIETHPTGDGQTHWMRTDKVPFRDEEGRIIGIVVFSVDITERKHAESALQESEEKLKNAYLRLQQVDRDRTQFLNNAAHEMATPLTPIKLQLRLLQIACAARDLEGIGKAVTILDRNFQRLAILVKDLLDAARLQAASLKMHFQDIDLRDTVFQSVETYLAAAREAGVRLVVDEDMPSLTARLDGSRIGQVVDNLVSNALKFTPTGGTVRVELSAPGPGVARIRVSDTGSGIRSEDLERLFRPFSQVHDTQQRNLGGTGLGLYVCRGIIEAHGGHIEADSQGPGQGCVFWFDLPRTPPAGILPEPLGPPA